MITTKAISCCIMRDPIEAILAMVVAPAVVVLLINVNPTGGTCNEDQRFRCRRAVDEGQLDTIGGGQCTVRQYVQYTHVCTLSNFAPSVDFCCCSHRPLHVMCCRYQHDFVMYRCVETDDTIDAPAQSVSLTFAWEQLLFIALAVIVSAGCILLCCITCLCRRCRRYQYSDYNDSDVDAVTLVCCHDKHSTPYSCCDVDVASSDDISEMMKCNGAAVAGGCPTTALLSYSVGASTGSGGCGTPCHIYRHQAAAVCATSNRFNSTGSSSRLLPSAPLPSCNLPSMDCHDCDDASHLHHHQLQQLTPSTKCHFHPWTSSTTGNQRISDVIVRLNGTDCRTMAASAPCACISNMATMSHSILPPSYDDSLQTSDANKQRSPVDASTLPENRVDDRLEQRDALTSSFNEVI